MNYAFRDGLACRVHSASACKLCRYYTNGNHIGSFAYNGNIKRPPETDRSERILKSSALRFIDDASVKSSVSP